jgi:hypothetical protein
MKRTITVIGKRWFERVNGNTYHSTSVYVDGVCIGHVSFTYGYGSHYQQTALELLKKHFVYSNDYQNEQSALWREVENAGDFLVDSVSDVQRKKDL